MNFFHCFTLLVAAGIDAATPGFGENGATFNVSPGSPAAFDDGTKLTNESVTRETTALVSRFFTRLYS